MTDSIIDNTKFLQDLFQKLMDDTQQDDNELNSVIMSTLSILLREDGELIDRIVTLIFNEIKLNNSKRLLRALNVLNECMDNGGEHFQKQINKNKFLNSFIKIVSTKLDGKHTPNEIRTKIMDHLFLWTHKYPNLDKIKKVYDSLYDGIKNDNKLSTITTNTMATATTTTASAVTRKPSLVDKETEEKLKKLLNSKNPEDHKLANLLIQHSVKQETKKQDLRSSQNLTLDNAKRLIQLLDEMIKKNANNCNTSSENETMKDLYEQCKQLSPIINKMPQIIDEEELLDKALGTNDRMISVIKEYEKLYMKRNSEQNENENQLITNQQNDVIISNVTDIDENCVIIDSNDDHTKIQKEIQLKDDNNEMDLKDIIFNNPLVPASLSSSSFIPDTPLIPIPLYTDKNDKIEIQENQIDSKNPATEIDNKKNDEIIEIIEKMFENELKTNERIGKFNNEESARKKKSLNEIKTINENNEHSSITDKENNRSQNIQNPKNINDKGTELQLTDIELLLSHNSSISKTEKSKIIDDDVDLLLSDDEICDGASGISSNIDIGIVSNNNGDNEKNISKLSDEKILKILKIYKQQHYDQEPNLFNVSKQFDFKSRKYERNFSKIISKKQGLQVFFNKFTKQPNDDNNISAYIILISNFGFSEIKDLQLNAGIKMPCKLYLSGFNKNYLPAIDDNPPKEQINQKLFVYNPTNDHDINITFILSYKINESPNAINEPIETKI